MAVKVHYEILVQEKGASRWAMHDAKANRDGAITLAQAMMAEGFLSGIKVVKQLYDEGSGDYRAITIYEDGRKKTFIAVEQEDVPGGALCSHADDFYTAASRKAIHRYLFNFLSRNKITVTELLHRPDLLDILENTGTFLQHAVQSAALARSGTGESSVQHNIRTLHRLVGAAFARVFYDAKTKVLPFIEIDQFDELAAKMAKAIDGAYVLNGAIVNYLRNGRNWEEKLVLLLRLSEQTHSDGAGGRLLHSCIGSITAEVVHSASAIQELVGPKNNLGEALLSLAYLLIGRIPPGHDPQLEALPMLSRQFADDHLPKARLSLALRLVAELKRYKRLCPGSMTDELRMLREISEVAKQLSGRYLNPDALAGALDLRSQRLIGHDSLTAYIADTSPEEQIDLLFVLESHIHGSRNKRQLLGTMKHIVEAEAFRDAFLSSQVPVLKRLQRLSVLIASAKACDAPDKPRQDLAKAFDKLACAVADQARLFEKIAAQPANNAEKMLMISKLFSTGVFADGNLAIKAREAMLQYTSKPDFLSCYMETIKTGGDQVDALSATNGLIEILKVAGIDPGACFKAMIA